MKLAVGRGVRIVLDPDGKGEALLHARAKVKSLERNVHRSLDTSGLLIETRRNPEAETDYAVLDQLLDGGVEPCEERVLRFGRRRRLPPMLDGAVAMNDAGQDLRAAEVDADDARVSQQCWLP